MATIPLSLTFAILLSTVVAAFHSTAAIDYGESTISDIQSYFADGSLTSRKLVSFYLTRIQSLNPYLRAVIEVNPDALHDADIADRRRLSGSLLSRGILHGIPILLKDNIATRDRLNTTAGSFALLGSVVPRDAGVAGRLRSAGAIILGKASLSEWANFRTDHAPNGWCARNGQGKNPYVASADPCGSSSGSAISTAAGMAAAALGTETDGSIICPASANSVVGIKPTVGLTSRAGVIPVSPRQDTVGPMARTVADAVAVLEAIVGYDKRDAEATAAATRFVPEGGYRQFLKVEGLKGKRLGILCRGFSNFSKDSLEGKTLDRHYQVMREKGAILLDNLEIANASLILDSDNSGEEVAVLAEFKLAVNAYLSELVTSPVRSLSDLIAFNNEHKIQEKIEEYGQTILLEAEKTNGLDAKVRAAIKRMAELSANGIERLMKENKLDAVVTPDYSFTPVLAINGYPGISVPAGYHQSGVPFGICFGGLKGSEPTLIEIAYAFEQATKARKPPLLFRREIWDDALWR
ncbi:Fatty acid amide hydrolase [Platanthera guangdongensis]|uniref:Fatty acid amide hydrolase n=1 Tax=Platanthera guangdongensis TaxID=2320717 RepID=A0ABR2LYV2_9ASPA